jgi:hypothetical protein
MRRPNFAVFLLLGLLLVSSVPALADPITLSSMTFSPVQWASSTNNSFVEFSVSTTGGSGSPQFLNITSANNVWTVQNLPVGFEDTTMATLIDAELFDSSKSYSASLSSDIATSAPAYVGPMTYSVGGTTTYMGNDNSGIDGAGTFTDPGLFSDTVLSFNTPLFNFVYHTGVPDLAQGPNECGPTSAADSLTWLNDKFHLGLNMTTQQIRDALKDGGHMKTDARTGTTDPNFIAGKNTFVQEKTLPISTHVIRGNGNLPSFENLVKELEKGQDVELALTWKDRRGGGHWVTLVGAIDLPFGLKGIAFNDPDDGKTQTQWSWLDPLVGGKYRVHSYGRNNVYDFAVAESIPEPGTLLLVLSGMLGAGLVRRRQTSGG